MRPLKNLYATSPIESRPRVNTIPPTNEEALKRLHGGTGGFGVGGGDGVVEVVVGATVVVFVDGVVGGGIGGAVVVVVVVVVGAEVVVLCEGGAREE